MLLDNESIINKGLSLGLLSCDDYSFSDAGFWQNYDYTIERNCYVWAQDIYGGEGSIEDWNVPYSAVMNANIVLEALQNIPATPGNIDQWNNIKGWALFTRAWHFHELVQVFSLAYDAGSGDVDPGIPLRLTADISVTEQRSSVKQTYRQIIKDLMEAKALLRKDQPAGNFNRPSKVSAYALLARVYLNMREYDNAGIYADSSLQENDELIAFKSLNKETAYPFAHPNCEILFDALQISRVATQAMRSFIVVDSALYLSYNNNDLRKVIYFDTGALGKLNFRRGYSGLSSPFVGLATDEMYLIKAECLARNGLPDEGMKTLNKLLASRWNGAFDSLKAKDQAEALAIILVERRKELVWRGSLRWADIKRLNKESANIRLIRKLNDTVYPLEANDRRYALPIPGDEILHSGIQQNER
jgi:hypothetical protein